MTDPKIINKLTEKCNIKTNQCRGGSMILYALMKNNESFIQTYYIPNFNIEKLEIITGPSHTSLRYKDNNNTNFIYIDPTIGQFIRDFEGVFVGSKEDLISLSKKYRGFDVENYYDDPQWTGVRAEPIKVHRDLMEQAEKMLMGGSKKIKRKSKKKSKKSN